MEVTSNQEIAKSLYQPGEIRREIDRDRQTDREMERCYLKHKRSHVSLAQGYLIKLHCYSQGSILQKI